MSAIVIDTNVLLVADGQGDQMTAACQIRCLERLKRIRSSEQVVLDRGRLILGEYHNRLSPNRSSSPGSAFLKWLLQVQADANHVAEVTLTPTDAPLNTRFMEFPGDARLEAMVDPSDRKFIAAANAHPEKPPIVEAADSKWLDWEPQLAGHGIRLEILCRTELKALHARKTRRRGAI